MVPYQLYNLYYILRKPGKLCVENRTTRNFISGELKRINGVNMVGKFEFVHLFPN